MKNKKNVYAFIVILFILILGLSLFFFLFHRCITNKENINDKEVKKSPFSCQKDEDCVSAGCCGDPTCVSKEYAPNCSGIMCAAVCTSLTLDCGQGSCVCQGGRCRVKWNEEFVKKQICEYNLPLR